LRPLPVPSLIDATNGVHSPIELNLQKSRHDFGTGAASQTLGISQSYLGPVVKVKSGQQVPFEVRNEIGEVSTLHWHGLHIPGTVDGGPHQEIEPGGTWRPELPVVQPAATCWFHSHTHGRTARQTYGGLAGVMHIEDDASLSADLPKTYAVDDFTLVLQDKSFDAQGRMSYQLTGEVIENGYQGDSLVINGTLAPVAQTVPQGLVRLRILNACNARFLTLSLSGSQPLNVIASDGGFLSSTVETGSLEMSPGERYEILLDMSVMEEAALMVSFSNGGGEGLGGFLEDLLGRNRAQTALVLTRDPSRKGITAPMPDRLAGLAHADPRTAMRKRDFTLNMGEGEELAALAANWGNVCGSAGGMGINGRPMNMDHVNFKVRKGEAEIWRIQADEQRHPFHIHGCSFRILRQDGAPPPAHAEGWKDMVSVQEGWSEVLVRFDHLAAGRAPFMYHCHILEHEDCGMMGQFTVVQDG
jgi:blue copper oxidase